MKAQTFYIPFADHSSFVVACSFKRFDKWFARSNVAAPASLSLSEPEDDSLVTAFERLVGTRIKTDITTGKKRHRQGFALIESCSIVERTSSNRMSCIELTLSEWLYNAIATEVLTLSRDYFRLRKASSADSTS